MKAKAIAWKTKDGMRPKDIKKRLKVENNIDVSMSTISTWWNEENMKKLGNLAPDRINVQDVRYNPKQRPDILVDMVLILARKVRAVALTGVPYSRDVVRLLAIHIYHKLVTFNIYNQQGQRKNPDIQIDEEIIHAV